MSEEHIPTVEQLADRVISAIVKTADAKTSEEMYLHHDYARRNLIELIERLIK